jgi:predicted dehydrogenase
MSKTYRTALIGLGKRASDYYLPAITTSQTCKLVSVCDSDRTRLEKYSEGRDIRAFTDYRKLIRQSSIDMVIAATPHHLYRDIVERAAISEVHVLKEKPFATNTADAKKMVNACSTHGIHLMTALQRRLDPLYVHFAKVLKRVGNPFYIEGKYSLFIKNLDDGWRANRKASGGGCLIDMGYHLVDLVIWYFGLPDRVHAEHSSSAVENGEYSVEDTCTVMMKYDTGLHGFLTVSRRRAPKTEYLEVLGSNGVARLDRNCISLFDTNGNLSGRIKRDHVETDRHLNQVNYFTQVVRGESPNYSSPENHMQHMKFIESCYRSERTGSYVKTNH